MRPPDGREPGASVLREQSNREAPSPRQHVVWPRSSCQRDRQRTYGARRHELLSLKDHYQREPSASRIVVSLLPGQRGASSARKGRIRPTLGPRSQSRRARLRCRLGALLPRDPPQGRQGHARLGRSPRRQNSGRNDAFADPAAGETPLPRHYARSRRKATLAPRRPRRIPPELRVRDSMAGVPRARGGAAGR
jgi:hypothetical protein